VLATLVVLGMGIPTLYRLAVPRLEVRRELLLAAAPSEPEGRLRMWFTYGQPQIHHALVMARFSHERPWFVTHLRAPVDEKQPPEIWGIDFEDLPVEVVRLEGSSVRVILDAPRLLARDVLVGDRALGVPVFPATGEIPDPRELALRRLAPYLRRLEEGLVKDVPGTEIVIEVGGLKANPIASEREG
jgi:hypothetical protein